MKMIRGWRTSPVKTGRVSSAWKREVLALGRPCNSLPVPKGVYKKAGKGLFKRHFHDRTGCCGFKLSEDRFSLHIKKKFPPVMVVRHRNRIFRETVESMSLEVFKGRLAGFWETLSSKRCPCPWQGAWN